MLSVSHPRLLKFPGIWKYVLDKTIIFEITKSTLPVDLGYFVDTPMSLGLLYGDWPNASQENHQ